MDTIPETVPLSTTMKEQIVALRSWAINRAKNTYYEPNMEENKDMPVFASPRIRVEKFF